MVRLVYTAICCLYVVLCVCAAHVCVLCDARFWHNQWNKRIYILMMVKISAFQHYIVKGVNYKWKSGKDFFSPNTSCPILFSKEVYTRVCRTNSYTHNNPIGLFFCSFFTSWKRKNDNLMTYGSGLEFSWRGFRFCNTFGYFFFFFFLIFRPHRLLLLLSS